MSKQITEFFCQKDNGTFSVVAKTSKKNVCTSDILTYFPFAIHLVRKGQLPPRSFQVLVNCDTWQVARCALTSSLHSTWKNNSSRLLFSPEFPRGILSGNLGGGQCGSPVEALTLFQTKICDFPFPISVLTENCIHYFRPDPYPILIAKTFENFLKFQTIIKSHLSGEENKKKGSLLRTVPNSRSKCKYLTLFQTKMVKIDTLFRTKRLKTHTLWGRPYLYGLYEKVPPPPPRGITSHGSIKRTQLRHFFNSLNLETHKFYYVTLLNLICDGNNTAEKKRNI